VDLLCRLVQMGGRLQLLHAAAKVQESQSLFPLVGA
jgi:hypothetical protein